ncbi:hypothetical protein ACFLR2_02425 [Chlamydiota bacterium]
MRCAFCQFPTNGNIPGLLLGISPSTA